MASRPFLFEHRDFDQMAEANAVPPEARPQFSQLELDGAVAGAQQRGFEEGLADAKRAIESNLTRLMTDALARMHELQAAETMRTAEAQAMAIEIASGLLRKLMPELANQASLEGISALVKQVMMDRFEEPRLIIRVHDSMIDPLTLRLSDLAQQSGFGGQYALMADTALGITDCRIEWSNGGVERSIARLWDNVQISLAQLQAAVLPHGTAAPAAPLAADEPSSQSPIPSPNESETA